MWGTNKKENYYRHEANKLYGSSSQKYAANDLRKWNHPSKTALILQELCEKEKFQNVLELGVGTGRYFPFLNGQKYTGVDVCSAMIEKARPRAEILSRKGFKEWTFVEDEISHYLNGSPEKSFDFIFSIGCIGYHVPLNASLIQLLSQVIAPGGALYFQTTQASLLWRLSEKMHCFWNRMYKKNDSYDFFCTVTRKQLKKMAQLGGFYLEWIREADAKWFDKPMLLSLMRKNL